MAEKKLIGRIVQKHDVESNWQKATNFAPMEAELIIYDKDENNACSRVKIGDGETNVNDLPFLFDFATDEEILAAMIEADLMPAAQLEDGSLLAADENNVLLI